jgi:2-methylisocitrate lyase-like PEP mutase family enzyme
MSDHSKTFRRLHAGPDVLRLVNCWDAGSARVLDSLGAPAIATTSAGLCWSSGYPDGDALPLEVLVASVRAIARVIRVPLSVDIEGGYSGDPARVAELVVALADVGAVGINLEDGADSPDLLVAKIERVKQRTAQAGVDVFVNARVDVYLRGLVPEPARVAESIARGRRYASAGADGLFVPKVVAAEEIRAITSSVALPLNVLSWAGMAPIAELPALGVRRISSGSTLAQVAYGHAATAATAFLREGRTDLLTQGVLSYAELNPLFARA